MEGVGRVLCVWGYGRRIFVVYVVFEGEVGVEGFGSGYVGAWWELRSWHCEIGGRKAVIESLGLGVRR